MTDGILPVGETIKRTELDRNLLLTKVSDRPEGDLVAGYLIDGRPLGDACESLRDLVAHVLMWDEINLAVLTEARRGRAHWSLDPRWETPGTGTLLNVSGVIAGRRVPVSLLLHRFTTVCAALLAELAEYDDTTWVAPTSVQHARATSMGALAQYVMTVPQVAPYWHAAHHLGELAVMAPAE